MEDIGIVLKKIQNSDELLDFLKGFKTEDIQITWYGARRFKHSKNHRGSVCLNDFFKIIYNNNIQEPLQLKKIVTIIEKLDAKANDKLKKESWFLRTLHKIIHFVGRIFFDRKKVEKIIQERISKYRFERLGTGKVDVNLLTQIHGGRLSSSEVQFEPALRFVQEYLTAKNSKNPSPQLKPVIEKLGKAQKLLTALQTENFEETLKQGIADAFSSQTALLIPGGWKNNLAMYYEVIPVSDAEATFRIYNLARNAEHHLQEATSKKRRHIPCVELRGVSKENFMEAKFGKALHEMLHQDQDKENEYTTDDVYTSLKMLLKADASFVQVEGDSIPFMTVPEFNVSPFRSLMGFLATQLPNDIYKQLKIEFKIESLLAHAENLAANNEFASFTLIEKGLKKTSRSIDRLHKKNLIDQSTATSFVDQLSPLTEWLENHKEVKKGKFRNLCPDPENGNFLTILDSFKPLTRPAKITQELQAFKAEAIEAPTTSLIAEEIYSYGQSLHEKDVNEVLAKLEKVCQKAWDEKGYLGLHVGLEKVIFDFPSDKKFWQQRCSTKEQAKSMIIQLGKLAEHYFKACLMIPNSQAVTPEKELTLYILKTLQQHCVEVISPGNEFNMVLDGSRLESFTNTKIAKKFEEYAKFSTFDYDKRLLGRVFFHHCHFGDHISIGESCDTFRKLFSFEFDPECHQKFTQWSQAKPQNIVTYTDFFASDALPDWLKSVRNTFFIESQMRKKSLNVVADANNVLKFRCIAKHPYQHHVALVIEGDTTPQQTSKISSDSVGDPSNRYLLLMRPFASSKIKAFFKSLINSREENEKDWLTKDPKSRGIDLFPEEYRELMQLFANDYHTHGKTHLQALAIVDFFIKHPEKFQDPDYQTIFQQQFFAKDLEIALKNMKQFWGTQLIQKTVELLSKNFRQLSLANSIQPSVFLLQMLRYLSKVKGSKVAIHLDIELLKLLEIPGISIEEKSVIYAELAAFLSEKAELTEKEKNDFLMAIAFLQRYPVPLGWQDLKVEDQLRKAPHLLASTMQEHIKNLSSATINEMMQKVYPQEEAKKWTLKQEGNTFIFTSGKSRYYPLQGVIFLESHLNQMRPLPKAILDYPSFSFAFPNQTMGHQKAPFIYSFLDKDNNEVLIQYSPDDNRVFIEKKFQDRVFSLIDPDKLIIERFNREVSRLCSKFLIKNFSAWEHQGTIYLVDPKTSETKYRCTQEGSKIKICRLKDQAIMDIPSDLMHRFEHPDFIQEWHVNGKLKEVELPRFGLTFSTDPDNSDVFHCKEFKGWHLNRNKTLPTLGLYNGYILLENGKGEKKALFPKVRLGSTESLSDPTYHFFANDDQDSVQYITFDVTEDGLLKTASLEENLYAAEVFTLGQEHFTSAYYLRKYGPKLMPYTQGELKRLKEIASNKSDQDSNAKAIRAYASYLMIKNGQKSEADLDIAASNFHLYLSNLKNISALKLSSEEEIFLLKTFLNSSYDPIFYLRLEELDHEALKFIKIETRSTKQEHFEFLLPKEEVLQRLSRNPLKIPNLKTAPLTRLEPELNENFFGYYEWARQASVEERKWLEAALSFNRNTKEHKFGNLLEIVLRYPEQFSPVIKDTNDYQWFRDLASKAEKLYAENADSFRNPSLSFPAIQLRRSEKIIQPGTEPKTIAFTLPEGEKSYAELCEHLFIITPSAQSTETSKTLKTLLPKWKSTNGSLNDQIDKLILDIDALDQVKTSAAYQLASPEALAQLEKILGERGAQERLKTLESDILKIANQAPKEKGAYLLHRLKSLSGVKKPFTLEELLVNFGKQETLSLQKRNPALTDDEIAVLYEKIGSFLLQATHEQKRLRCLTLLNDVKASAKDSLEEAENLQLLGEALFANRSFDPKTNTVELVFEYCLNLLIRERQLNKMDRIQPNTVTQMLMGEGKTTVLYMLAGLMRADGENISLLVLPEHLFGSISTYSQKVHFESFGKELRTLHFDRNSSFTKHSLSTILDNLKKAQEKKECIIMTSKSIACLILKYIELAITHTQEQKDELKLMSCILRMLSKKGYPLIDEIDLILKVLHEVSFSSGSQVPVEECEYATIAKLFEILFTNPDIKKIARCESDPNPDQSAPILTPEIYETHLKRPLAEAFIQSLQGMELSSISVQEKVQNFGKELTPQDKNLLLAYLCQDKEKLGESQNYYDALDGDIQEIIALASEQISRFLSHTLTMTSNENYGFSERGGLFAGPYEAADTPKEGSEHKNSHITMNTTFQMYLKYGLSEEFLIRIIQQLQERVSKELKEDPDLDITQTKGFKTFEKIKGKLEIPLINYSKPQLEALLKQINASIPSKISFIVTSIMPHLIRHESSLTFNPQNLIDFFDISSGFSGTLANAITMHHKLKVESEAGTDARTLRVLFEKSKNSVTVLSEDSIAEVIQGSSLDFDVLIDAGGYCKGKENSSMQIAKLMAKKGNCPVVVYDKKGIKQEVSQDSISAFKEDLKPGRKTVFDQSRSTGGDVRQKSTATAVVTIGKDLTARDLWQATRRMRGLDKGQKVSFWISSEVASIIRTVRQKKKDDPLDFLDILYFSLHNQANRLSLESFKACKQQLWNIPQMALLKAIFSETLQDDELSAVQDLLKAAWLKPANKMPKALYGKHMSEVESTIAIIDEIEKSQAFMKHCIEKLPSLQKIGFSLESSKKEAETIRDRFIKILPPTLKIQELDDNQTTEQEMEVESELQTESEMETDHSVELQGVSLQSMQIRKLIPITTLDQEKIEGNYMPLELYLSSKKELAPYAKAFNGISMTMNVLQFTMKTPTPDNLKLFGPNRIPLLNFAYDNEGSLMLISRDDSDEYRSPFNEKGMTLDNFSLCDPKKLSLSKQSLSNIKRAALNLCYSLEKRQRDEDWYLERLKYWEEGGKRSAKPENTFKSKEEVVTAWVSENAHREGLDLTALLKAITERVVRPLKDWTSDGSHRVEKAQMEKDIQKWLKENGKIETLQEQLFEKIVKCRFLNGECDFNGKAQRVLENWLIKEGAAKMRTFYQKHILLGFPLKRSKYNADSDLLKIFRKLKC